MKKKQQTAHKKQNPLNQWIPAIILAAVVGLLVFAAMSITGKATACPTITDASDSCVFTCQINSGLKIPIESTGAESCVISGKVTMLAFHSPSCGYCDAQEPVLDQLAQQYGDKLDLKYVCTEIHEGDDALCQENADGKYISYDEGKALVAEYQSAIGGTPTLVIDCAYTRVGSYAIRDQSENTTVELDDMITLIDTLLAS